HVYWMDDFQTMLPVMMHHSQHVYINLNENDRFVTEVPYRDVRFAQELKSTYPNHHYDRSALIMAKLRSIKSQTEVDLISKACEITDKAFRTVLNFVR